MFRERAAAISLKVDKESANKPQGATNGPISDVKKCEKQELVASTEFRDKAIKVYKHIVRNHPQYPRLDNVLYSSLSITNRRANRRSKKIYKTLIQFPRSVRVPDTLVNLGEIFFTEGKAPQAVKSQARSDEPQGLIGLWVCAI